VLIRGTRVGYQVFGHHVSLRRSASADVRDCSGRYTLVPLGPVVDVRSSADQRNQRWLIVSQSTCKCVICTRIRGHIQRSSDGLEIALNSRLRRSLCLRVNLSDSHTGPHFQRHIQLWRVRAWFLGWIVFSISSCKRLYIYAVDSCRSERVAEEWSGQTCSTQKKNLGSTSINNMWWPRSALSHAWAPYMYARYSRSYSVQDNRKSSLVLRPTTFPLVRFAVLYSFTTPPALSSLQMPHQCFVLFSYGSLRTSTVTWTCRNRVIYEAFANVSLCSWASHSYLFRGLLRFFRCSTVHKYCIVTGGESGPPAVSLVTPRWCPFGSMSPPVTMSLKNPLLLGVFSRTRS